MRMDQDMLERPRRMNQDALLGQLTGQPQQPTLRGDADNPIRAIAAWSGTPEQGQAMQQAQSAAGAASRAAFDRDTTKYNAMGGQVPADYRSEFSQMGQFDPRSVLGEPDFKGDGYGAWSAAMGGGQNPNAGYGGNTGVASPQVPQAGGLGSFAGKLEGFDSGKLNSAHDSPKYQFGRVMSQFDPKGGITQEMLDALNKLGLGSVSGKIGGDKIQIGGQMDPRFEGVTEFDIIRDLENGGGWQWGGLNGPAAQASPRASMGGAGAMGLPGLLSGDPMAGIQGALSQYGGQSANLQALLDQLAGA